MVSINDRSLRELTGVSVDTPFECDTFGAAQSERPATLGYLDTERFASALNANPNVTTVFTTEALAPRLVGKVVVVCEEPRDLFYRFQNQVGEANYVTRPSVVSPTARVHPRAFVSEHNVVIGDHVSVGPNANILADVTLGAGCVIGAGATLGGSGYEFKRTSRGILAVFHGGEVRLGANVRVGVNCAIDKGFSYRHTVLMDDVKLDDLVYVAHGVHIGPGSFLAGHVAVSGSTSIGANVWIGPGAIVSSRIRVGDGAFITLGSVVTRDVAPAEKVTGNFALPHDVFLEHLRRVRR